MLGFGLIFMGLIFVGILAAIKYAISSSRRSFGSKPTDPLRQLKMRLAKGELTPDEYEMLRAHLKD